MKNWKRFHEIFRILEAYVLRRARLDSSSKFEKELSILKQRKLFNFRKKNLEKLMNCQKIAKIKVALELRARLLESCKRD